MTTSAKKQIPVKQGLWTVPTSPAEQPQLIGSKCSNCGEIFFPRREKGRCINCQSEKIEDVKLSRKGKIYSFAEVLIQPPVYYKGTVPYAFGYVELPEGVRVETLFTGCPPDALKLGVEAELVIEKLHIDEEGNEVLAYKFKPVEC